MPGHLKKSVIVLVISCICLLMLGMSSIEARTADGVEGAVYFRDGRVVQFTSIGEIDKLWTYGLRAKLGLQSVSYRFTEIASIQLTNPEELYIGGESSEVLLTSLNGDRFTLSFVELVGNSKQVSRFAYVYNDPVTKKRRQGSDAWHDISHIEFGEHRGRWRRNPENNAYFPSTFNYDPYTGQKLVWEDEPPVPKPDTD